MGGRALGSQRPRLSREEYLRLSQILKIKLTAFYENVYIPRSLSSKESYGDIDLIVSGRRSEFNPHRDLGSTTQSRNSNILSFEYESYQIDLIEYGIFNDFIRFFHDFGDMGMILGMIVNRFGIRMNQRGLKLMHEEHKIALTNDLSEIFDFLGLSRESYEIGFPLQEDLFRFITSSKLFRRSMFCSDDPEFWNHHHRSELRRRSSFQEFIDFVRILPRANVDADKLDKDDVRAEALEMFSKKEEFDKLLKTIERRRSIKEKFNGKLVMEWTGMAGKPVGQFMAYMKSLISEDDFLTMSSTDIETSARSLFDEFREVNR